MTDLATGSGAGAAIDRTLEQALGAEVRRLRRDAGLTASDLAANAGISAGMLSKIESGQISASLATLQALAQALLVPISRLFAGFEQQRDCSHVPAGQGIAIERRGTKAGHHYTLLGHGLGGPVIVEPYLISLGPDAVPYTGFQHAGVEFIHMLTGALTYRHGERTYALQPGDSLLFDSAALHGPERLDRTPTTYLSIIVYPRDVADISS